MWEKTNTSTYKSRHGRGLLPQSGQQLFTYQFIFTESTNGLENRDNRSAGHTDNVTE